jgi:hypothetical protein
MDQPIEKDPLEQQAQTQLDDSTYNPPPRLSKELVEAFGQGDINGSGA